MTGEDEGPWVTSSWTGNSRDRKLHTSEECQSLENARSYRPARDHELDELDECRQPECSGGENWNYGGSGDGHIQSLRAAAEANRGGGDA